MATLDRWREFLETPKTLAFPQLWLIGRDGEPPIVTGHGELRMPSLTQFEYTPTGRPHDEVHFLRLIQYQRNNPHDPLARFRLCGIDESGLEWSLGWTVPKIDGLQDVWGLEGHTNGLLPHKQVSSSSISDCTEVIYCVPRLHPTGLQFLNLVISQSPNGPIARERVLEILGSTVKFEYIHTKGLLCVTATHSKMLPPTYCENWLGEPLRILMGQLIYPRLVARNLANGSSIVSVLPHLI